MNARTKLMTFGAYTKALEVFDFVVADMASMWERACSRLRTCGVASKLAHTGSCERLRLSQGLSVDFIPVRVALRYEMTGKLPTSLSAYVSR